MLATTASLVSFASTRRHLVEENIMRLVYTLAGTQLVLHYASWMDMPHENTSSRRYFIGSIGEFPTFAP